ncbi:MAG: hypothetical protein MJ239_04215 [Bacilli bacterium]|nr:hypothetical protein [Bacilli bacterium]
MAKLFIYYSYSGNGDAVAKKLAADGFEIRKIETVKAALPKNKFFGILVGGFRAARKARTPIKEFDANLEGFEEVYIGSPIWNGTFASPTNSLLDKLNLEGKKVTFVLYSGGGDGKGAAKAISTKYPEAKTVFLKEPSKYPEELEKLI